MDCTTRCWASFELGEALERRESRRISLGSVLCPVGDGVTLVRDRRLGVRGPGRVLLDAADEKQGYNPA
jgi:hypothetical protein